MNTGTISSAVTQKTAISCRGIVKHFYTGDNDVVALRGVDLDIKTGEFMMIVGPSGCGKTTLISVIASVLTADAGECTVLDMAYSQMREVERLDFRARNIGFVFQQYNLLPSLTIAQNVAVPLIINGTSRHVALDAANAILAEVGLGDRSNEHPAQLSGGQQQRVAIARALVHDPKILLCDEPTSALDHETGTHILELMRSMNGKRGTTFVVVTHDNRIFHYAHRIAHMDDGGVDKIYTPSETN